MTPEAHKEVVFGVISRQDVTPERLARAATFATPQILGRVASDPKTPPRQ